LRERGAIIGASAFVSFGAPKEKKETDLETCLPPASGRAVAKSAAEATPSNYQNQKSKKFCTIKRL